MNCQPLICFYGFDILWLIFSSLYGLNAPCVKSVERDSLGSGWLEWKVPLPCRAGLFSTIGRFRRKAPQVKAGLLVKLQDDQPVDKMICILRKRL